MSYLAVLPAPSKGQTAKWTFMVYMGADSSLESFGIDDFNEMAAVGSTNDVNIIVQFDRRPGGTSANGDWTTAKRFFIQKDMTPDPTSAVSDMGEVNMGDPQVLVDFMNWGMTNYTADRYFLVLWGHGLGWRGVVQDSSSSSDYLELDELAWAFQSIVANNGGKKIDLVGVDACRMTTEMNYQLKDYVSFFVGSQKDEPEPGWPYHTVLFNLTNDPDMGPAQLGAVVVDRYVESYVDNTGLSVALSLIDSARLEYLGEEMRRFVEQARSALPIFIEDFKDARLASENYEGNAVYDLYDILVNIRTETQLSVLEIGKDKLTPPTRLDKAVESAVQAIRFAVSYENNWDNPTSSIRTTNAHGMSIWYPLVMTNFTYMELDFSKATGWDSYLMDFRAVADGLIPDPEVELDVDVTLLDTDGDEFDDTVQLGLLSPQDATLEIEVRHHTAYWISPPLSIFLPGNIYIVENISLYKHTNYDLELYLLNDTRVWMNYTWLPNVLGMWLSMGGTITDVNGAYVNGATVTFENLDNGYTAIDESAGEGFFGAHVLLSGNRSTRNSVRITVEVGGELKNTTTLNVNYGLYGSNVEFIIGEIEPTNPDMTLISVLVGLVILEAVLILVLAILMKRRGKEPVEKTGDELLRDLKLE